MKQENKNWTDDLRNRMTDYEEELPAGGWERLEEELAAPMITGVKHPYRRMAVAAAILLLLISSVCVYFLQSPASDYMKDTQAALPPVLTEPERNTAVVSEQGQAELSKTTEPGKPSERIAQAMRKTSVEPAEERQVQSERPVDTVEMKEQVQAVQEQKQEQVQQPQEESVVVKRRSSSGHSSYTDANPFPSPKRNREKDHNWSVGVSVGNGLLASNNARPGFGKLSKAEGRGAYVQSNGVPSLGGGPANNYLFIGTANAISSNPEKAEAYRQVLYDNFDKETTTDVKHHLPITVGASVRFPLSKQFAIETGLNYTLLSSDLKAGENSHYTQEQKLHYLGIPVKGSWMFFDRKYVTLYLSAGGAMEKCVSGKLKNTYIVEGKTMETETSDLDVKPLQWSVTSAVGVQFNATPHFGIYAEPGVSYYFDDGSEVQTIRKEKPFNFNLQLGFRVTY